MAAIPQRRENLQEIIADRLEELSAEDPGYSELTVSEVRRIPEKKSRSANWDVEISGGSQEYRERFRRDLDGFRRRTVLIG